MKLVSDLSKDQWRDLMSYLLKVEDLAGLKNLKSKLIEHLKGLSDHENSTYIQQINQVEISKESRDLEISEKESLAEDIYELSSGTARYLGNGLVSLFGDNKLTTVVDLQKLVEFDFIDSVKLTDMLSTNNLPSQVEAHYRQDDFSDSKKAMIDGEIMLSDGESKLVFIKQDKNWIVEGNQDSLSEQAVTALSGLNEHFLIAVNSSLEYHKAEMSQNSMA